MSAKQAKPNYRVLKKYIRERKLELEKQLKTNSLASVRLDELNQLAIHMLAYG